MKFAQATCERWRIRTPAADEESRIRIRSFRDTEVTDDMHAVRQRRRCFRKEKVGQSDQHISQVKNHPIARRDSSKPHCIKSAIRITENERQKQEACLGSW